MLESDSALEHHVRFETHLKVHFQNLLDLELFHRRVVITPQMHVRRLQGALQSQFFS